MNIAVIAAACCYFGCSDLSTDVVACNKHHLGADSKQQYYLTSITRREELNQPLFSAIDAFEFPELHDESVAARNFFRHLSRLMTACGVRDFGMKVRAARRTAAAPLQQQMLS